MSLIAFGMVLLGLLFIGFSIAPPLARFAISVWPSGPHKDPPSSKNCLFIIPGLALIISGVAIMLNQ